MPRGTLHPLTLPSPSKAGGEGKKRGPNHCCFGIGISTNFGLTLLPGTAAPA